jgi:hypothetical protein
MSGVRAKFYVGEVAEQPGVPGGRVTLQACSRGARNAEWASATPSGTMTMQINNQPAFDYFVSLKNAAKSGYQPEVFITIETASDGWPGDGHEFVEADVPDNHYGFGKCAACGFPKDGEVLYEGTVKLDTPKPSHPNG